MRAYLSIGTVDRLLPFGVTVGDQSITSRIGSSGQVRKVAFANLTCPFFGTADWVSGSNTLRSYDYGLRNTEPL